jgi:hypothetical protein
MLPELEPEPAADQHGSTQVRKPTSDDPLLAWHRLVDMVDAEQVMVDDPLDHVEQAEADPERAGEAAWSTIGRACDGTSAIEPSAPSRRRCMWSPGEGHSRRC